MIYDCFTFFNELDLLELRLEELYSVVDKFVIVEADRTHSGKSKDFILEKNKARYKKWWNKIIYIKIENLPRPRFNRLYCFLSTRKNAKIKSLSYSLKIGSWRGENFQRNAIISGLSSAKMEDVILVGDLDEIPSSAGVLMSQRILNEQKIERVTFIMKNYKFYFNGLVDGNWVGTRAVKCSTLKNILKNKTQNIRTSFREKLFEKVIKKPYLKNKTINDGWHFSWIGDKKRLNEKMYATSHQELRKNKQLCEKNINYEFEYVNKNNFPKSLIKRKNMPGYKEFIK